MIGTASRFADVEWLVKGKDERLIRMTDQKRETKDD